MFIGHINTKIDAKGRVVVPAQFRKELAGITSLVARMSFKDVYLKVFTKEELERIYGSLMANVDEWSDNGDIKIMQWMGEAIYLEIDAQGRLLIPKEVKNKLKVTGELTFVGMGKSFAIWDAQRFEKHCNERPPFSINN